MNTHKQHLYGLHTVHAFLQHMSHNALTLFVAKDRHDDRIQKILDSARAHSLPVEQVAPVKLNQLTQDGVHQGVVLLAKVPEYQESDLEPLLTTQLKEQPLLLVLDSIQDPHNLGACLRTAQAAGVDLVIIPKDRSATLTPLVRKIATGAAEMIPVVQVTNLRRALQIAQKQGIWFIGLTASPQAVSLYKTALTGPLGLVLGSEGAGLRLLTEQQCDGLAYIPMHGAIESLNVSVAAGVGLFEAVRQRYL
jgi:23S rRNA (guanosine2251-2'-O)-methyltransferase